MTKKQQKFLAKGTHEVVSLANHARMRQRASKLDRDWPPDSLLDWDGKLLPMSSVPYVGRLFVREVGWKPAFRGGPKNGECPCFQ